jgi:hypothetical protein
MEGIRLLFFRFRLVVRKYRLRDCVTCVKCSLE